MKLTKVKDLILDDTYQVMPDMSEDDRTALRNEIQEKGVLVNVEIDENMHVIDGFNRVTICRELGIEEIPTTMRVGMTEQDKKAHARALNFARRHLTEKDKRKLIHDQILETPEKSDREIADVFGCSNKTVTTIRHEMESSGELCKLHSSPGADGVVRPSPEQAHKNRKEIQNTIVNNPEKSDREIAKELGVDHKTVGNQRQKIENVLQPSPDEPKTPLSRYSPEELKRAMDSLEGFDNDPFANLDEPKRPATLYNPSKREIEAVQDPDIARRVIENEGDIAGAIREHTRDELVSHLESVEAREIKQAEGVYDVLTIDPPWPMQKIETDKSPTQCGFDYPTMSIQEIKDMHIPAAENCHVFLWTTQKFLPDAFDILKAWNVKYVCEFVWNKGRHGMKPFNLPTYNCEFVLYGHIGSPKFIDEKDFYACFSADPTGHSIKPDVFYDMVRRVTAGRRLDMFNRREIEGFEVWGKESSDRQDTLESENEAG